MVHHHTPACKKESTATDTVCSKGYPKPLVERTFIDDRGYVQYRRRTEQDRWVVPHNRHLLLLADCHFNVEVSSTVNLIMYLYKYMYNSLSAIINIHNFHVTRRLLANNRLLNTRSKFFVSHGCFTS